MEEGCAQDDEKEADCQDLEESQYANADLEVDFDGRTNESAMIVFKPAAMAGVCVGKSRFLYQCDAFGVIGMRLCQLLCRNDIANNGFGDGRCP